MVVGVGWRKWRREDGTSRGGKGCVLFLGEKLLGEKFIVKIAQNKFMIEKQNRNSPLPGTVTLLWFRPPFFPSLFFQPFLPSPFFFSPTSGPLVFCFFRNQF